MKQYTLNYYAQNFCTEQIEFYILYCNKNIVKTINTKYKVAKNVKPFEIFVPP